MTWRCVGRLDNRSLRLLTATQSHYKMVIGYEEEKKFYIMEKGGEVHKKIRDSAVKSGIRLHLCHCCGQKQVQQ